jgi:phosphate transport system substrate-binding protein
MKPRTLLLLAALVSAGEARAAKIELKDGSVVMGDVTGAADNAYTIHMSVGPTVAIPGAAVLRIDGVVPEPPPPTVLRFTGSSTIGAKLAPALAVAYLKSKGAGESSGKEISPEESTIATAPPVQGLPEKIEIKAEGSAAAFKALGAGETEIGMATRPITQQEIVDLAELGDMTKATSEHILALDGVAVIVNPANPVQKLTKDQLTQIFCGAAKDWSTFGGKPGPIAIYARDDDSRAFDTFKHLVLGGCELAGSAKRFASSGELSDSVAADPGGIGFIGLADGGHSRAIPIAECKLKYSPSSFAVKTEEYPLSRRLFLYTLNRHAAVVEDFLGYTGSDPAQRVVQENGFTDLGIELDTADTQTARKLAALSSAVQMEKLTQFATVTDEATRLSVTFRFRKNSAELDNRGLVDLDRLKSYLRSAEAQGKHVLLLGFSDDQGVYGTNVELSLHRAQSIAAKLGGANVEAYGFGPEAPVACNTTPEGRDKNRHVEVWLR